MIGYQEEDKAGEGGGLERGGGGWLTIATETIQSQNSKGGWEGGRGGRGVSWKGMHTGKQYRAERRLGGGVGQQRTEIMADTSSAAVCKE